MNNLGKIVALGHGKKSSTLLFEDNAIDNCMSEPPPMVEDNCVLEPPLMVEDDCVFDMSSLRQK